MGRRFKNFLSNMVTVLKAIGITILVFGAFFGILVLIVIDEDKHINSCSICNSTNISRPYTDKRGFLSSQKVFYCYDCDKQYNVELMNRTYVKEKE